MSMLMEISYVSLTTEALIKQIKFTSNGGIVDLKIHKCFPLGLSWFCVIIFYILSILLLLGILLVRHKCSLIGGEKEKLASQLITCKCLACKAMVSNVSSTNETTTTTQDLPYIRCSVSSIHTSWRRTQGIGQ